MKIVFYSIILNNHQANVADELWELTGHRYCFVELALLGGDNKKGDTRDYAECPYLLRAWESRENWQRAMELAVTAECCVFSGVESLPFQKARMKQRLLSFDMSERWLKRGLKNLLSPTISKMWLAYWLGGWGKKPMYKLCCSAFAASDYRRLGMYGDKCYKWGYFTKVDGLGERGENLKNQSSKNKTSIHNQNIQTPIMWCARFLDWKHPELSILLAERLKQNGYSFQLDMYGEGGFRERAESMIDSLRLRDCISFVGNKPNTELMADMCEHEIFLFTSDKNEGWGAVANESMTNGCVLVASDAIGSIPYLVQDGVNGFAFRAPSTVSNMDHPDMEALDVLYEKVVWLLNHKEERQQIRQNAMRIMQEVWSPSKAAAALLQLINDLQNGMDTSIKEGPCSKA